MRRIGDVLHRTLRTLRVSDAGAATSVFTRWRDIVGDVIADNATPKRLEKGRLTIEVEDPAWATQLRFLESSLLATLRDALGDEIDSFEVRVRRSR